MTLYTTYQCSICRRKKDIIKDDKRAIPNLCVITKGCGGRLFPVGETTSASATAQVAGLTDWYPRGTAFNADSIEIEVEKPPVKLSTTSTASITVAVSFASGVTPPQELSAVLTQRKIEDISFQQYIFNSSVPARVFSGRDSTGNNLRFDTTAIYQGRVFVLVNGVAKFNGEDLVLTPNTVTFNSNVPAGSVVNVGVYVERNTVQRTLNFVRNDAQTSFQGAWYNIRHVAFPPSNDRWVLYTCNEIGDFTTSSRARLDKFESQPGVSIPLGNVKFLLASEPYGFLDRNMNFVANADEFGQNFCITAKLESVNELYIESQFIKEIYPPIHLKSEVPDSSFILEDSYEGISVTNEIFPNLISSKIIGPT
jgi:hypothetical protein